MRYALKADAPKGTPDVVWAVGPVCEPDTTLRAAEDRPVSVGHYVVTWRPGENPEPVEGAEFEALYEPRPDTTG